MSAQPQSHFHDQLATQARDCRKAKFLSAVSVPLIYVRYIDNDSRFYRFYTPNDSQEVFYNLVTQEGRQAVSAWLRSQMIKHRWTIAVISSPICMEPNS
ncbi:MAG: hypothetical protein LH702_18080 [Phormidesmis sp. CAN_BIN44]|nr:hypothetical protein [Phormidesmis sp. CAN_BIN44]